MGARATVLSFRFLTFRSGMAAIGEASFSLTKKMSKAVLVESEQIPGTTPAYQFRLRKRKSGRMAQFTQAQVLPNPSASGAIHL